MKDVVEDVAFIKVEVVIVVERVEVVLVVEGVLVVIAE